MEFPVPFYHASRPSHQLSAFLVKVSGDLSFASQIPIPCLFCHKLVNHHKVHIFPLSLLNMSAGLIVASVLAALFGVFFLILYFRLLTRCADRRKRAKGRQARTRRTRRRRGPRERDVELGPIDGGLVITRDPMVVRKAVQADVEFAKGEWGRGFVDVPLDGGEEEVDSSPRKARRGAVATTSGRGSEGDGLDSGQGAGSSSSSSSSLPASSKGSKTRDNSSRNISSSGTAADLESVEQEQKERQHRFPRRAARPARRHGREAESRRSSFQPSTPKPNWQAFPASSVPLPTSEVSEPPVSSSSPYPPPDRFLSSHPYPPAAATTKSNRVSKSSTWSYRINQDGFKQVQYRGVIPPPPSSFRSPPPLSLVSGRYVRPASSVYCPEPPQPVFIRPASSVYDLPSAAASSSPPPVVMYHDENTHTAKHPARVPPEPLLRGDVDDFLGKPTREQNPFDDANYERNELDEQDASEDGWTSRVASTAFMPHLGSSSSVVGGAGRSRDLTEVKLSTRFLDGSSRSRRVSMSTLSRMGRATEGALEKLTGPTAAAAAADRGVGQPTPPPLPVPAAVVPIPPAPFVAVDVEAARGSATSGSLNEIAKTAPQQQQGPGPGVNHAEKYWARVEEEVDNRETLGRWVRRGLALSECDSTAGRSP